MRIVYYTHPSYLDTSLPLLRDLSQLAEIHALVEIFPVGWNSAFLNVPYESLQAGVFALDDISQTMVPPQLDDYWSSLASVHLVVYKQSKIFHPQSLRVARQVTSLIRKLHPDLIHLDDIRTSSLLLPLFPSVVGIHDSEPHSGESRSNAQSIKHHLLKIFMTHRAKSIIFHSKYCQDIFKNRYSLITNGISVIPFGALNIFREWQTKSAEEEATTVLFFGRISLYKGLEVLLKAAEIVAQAIPEVCFIVAGRPVSGYHIPQLPDLSNNGVFETHLRYISGNDLCELFQRAAIVALPYIEASQSGVLATAYAFHKPVVAAQVGGLPEFMDDGLTGILIPPRDPKALADAIIKLLKNSKLRGEMSRYINKKNETDLSWGRIALQYVDIYRDILKRTRR